MRRCERNRGGRGVAIGRGGAIGRGAHEQRDSRRGRGDFSSLNTAMANTTLQSSSNIILTNMWDPAREEAANEVEVVEVGVPRPISSHFRSIWYLRKGLGGCLGEFATYFLPIHMHNAWILPSRHGQFS